MQIEENIIKRFKETITKEKDLLDKKLTKDTELEVYIKAIYLGYLDACRTFNGQSKVKKDHKEIKVLAEEIKKYIDEDGSGFFFDDYCKKLTDKYNMTFGQAQKIVNMAFKYLYCLAEDSIKDKFNCCHMPLDGIMLEWISENCEDVERSKIGKWSKLEKGSENEKEDKNGLYTYAFYKNVICEYCENFKIYPLQLDFENWVSMSQKIAAREYLKNFNEKEKKEDIPCTLIRESMDRFEYR